MAEVVPVHGVLLERVLDATHPIWHDGLDRQAYGRLDAARTRTAWGRRGLGRFALVEGADLLACAEQYGLRARLDGRAVRVSGIGSVFTDPARLGEGHGRVLLEALLDRAARSGAEMALLFSRPGIDPDWRLGFDPIPSSEATLAVAESSRHGAPMTLVRGGEPRDLAAIVAMGRVQAKPFRFHLDRDLDFVQHAIATGRLRAGLGSPGSRQLLFVIAEEGITAAAYAVVAVSGSTWTIEECGDRDASGARVGALLQALIARDPTLGRPTIRGWLPPRFLPPQVTVVRAAPPAETMMVRGLAATSSRLSSDDVLYWHSDVF